jgi:molybdenum cofactor synthesis domain-containing protein
MTESQPTSLSSAQPQACLLIIGNEILSGRTQDKNLAWLATELNEIGVALREVRVIPDHAPTIISTVNECRARFTYVFTTGGIGPTHDDITSQCIADAFGDTLFLHPDAQDVLTRHYGAENLNEARLKMGHVPRGARLIANPVSAAPGFIIGNVYVMAGVPRIMQAMFDGLKHELKGGAKMLSGSLSVYVTEGIIAAGLTELQDRFADVDIGSYPFIRAGRLGTSLVCRSTSSEALATCLGELRSFLTTLAGEVEDDPGA